MLAEQGVEAGGAGDAGESLDQIDHGLAGCGRHGFERSQSRPHSPWSLIEEIVCETFSLSPYRAVAVPGSYLQGVWILAWSEKRVSV